MPARSVLLTGGSGFVGRHTIPLLVERGYSVHALSRAVPRELSQMTADQLGRAVTWHSLDIHESEEVDALIAAVRPTHLLHLAWDTRHGVFWNAPENFNWIVSTKLMLQSFIEHGGSRAVMAGSCAEYDWESGEEYFRENHSKLLSMTLYGQSKLAARKRLFAEADKGALSAAWGRVFLLFGPYEGAQRLVSSAIISLLKGEPFNATAGDQIRDFSYTEDVGQGFVRLLDSNVTGDVNIASGEGRSITSMLQLIGELTGRADLIRLGTRPKDPNDPARVVAAVERLHNEVGFTFPASIEERVASTVQWWRSRSNYDV